MSCVLTKGRTEPCRDGVGGVKFVYLFPFVEYDYTEILGVKGVEITQFPDTSIYKYAIKGGSFVESIENDDEGVKYNQSLSFTLIKQDLETTNELDAMSRIDLRYIVELNDGSLKMGGVYNASRLTDYSIESGGAKNSLNGYNLTFTGIEEFSAPFLDNLNILGDNLLLLENGFYLLLEDSGKIIIE